MKEQLMVFINNNPSVYGLSFKDYKDGRIEYSPPDKYSVSKAEGDLSLFASRQTAIYNRRKIAEGDYVILLDGSISRVTVGQWDDRVQVGGYYGGSYYISDSGRCSYSGGCGDSVKLDSLVDTGTYKPGMCWLFSQGRAVAHNGVYKELKFKVFKQIK